MYFGIRQRMEVEEEGEETDSWMMLIMMMMMKIHQIFLKLFDLVYEMHDCFVFWEKQEQVVRMMRKLKLRWTLFVLMRLLKFEVNDEDEHFGDFEHIFE